MSIATPADGNEYRRQRFTYVRQPEAKPEFLDHRLYLFGGVDLERFLTPPFAVAVNFDLFRQSSYHIYSAAD